MKHLSPYCGQPGLEVRGILSGSLNKSDNAVLWFNGGKTYFVHKARTGIRWIRDILDCEEGSEVLVPSYNCGSEVDALLASGFKVSLYRIDRQGEIDIDDLINRISSRTKIVYVIHYFGFPQPLKNMRELCNRKGLYLVEDCALSLFSSSESEKIGTTGDISVYSFPKTLPVPDGGALQVNNPLIHVKTHMLGNPPTWPILRACLPLLKSTILRTADDAFGPVSARLVPSRWYFPSHPSNGVLERIPLPDLPESYYYDDSLTDKAISSLTSRILPSFDPDAIRNRRRSNFLVYLRSIKFGPDVVPMFPCLPPGVCPLCFPVLMNQPALMADKLIRHRIASIPWWSGYHRRLPWEDFSDACYLKDHILALPVHQGIGEKEVEFISGCFNELISGNPFH